MKKLLVLGAAGRTGSEVVAQAVAAGYSVTAFVRKEDNLEALKEKVTVFVGDATNEKDLAKALKGKDAVISTLGPTKPGDTVVSVATGLLIKTARQEKVQRVIMMSSFLAIDRFKPNPIVKFALQLMNGIVSHFLSAEKQFATSGLDYTIVYATRLTNEALNSNYRVVPLDQTVGAGDHISRANVAEYLVKQIDDPTYVRSGVLITDD